MTSSPVQLELELITISGQQTTHNTPCDVALGTATHALLIPGLDASLCRCATCTGRAIGGIWWFDSQMRDAVLKRRVPFKFKVSDGETLRDNE